MSSPGGPGDEGAGEGAGEGAREGANEGANEGAAVRQPRSFKLRFAAQRELGRSYVSAVKPLGLPAPVAGKFYARAEPDDGEEVARALTRVRRAFELTPRELHAAPLTSAHEYGWWWREGAARERSARGDERRDRRLRDSAWMKERLRVLAADAHRDRRR